MKQLGMLTTLLREARKESETYFVRGVWWFVGLYL